MNERIQELYITAMREDCGEKWDTQEEFIERFAELIVRECASIVEDAVDRREPASSYVGKIKEYFRVKQ